LEPSMAPKRGAGVAVATTVSNTKGRVLGGEREWLEGGRRKRGEREREKGKRVEKRRKGGGQNTANMIFAPPVSNRLGATGNITQSPSSATKQKLASKKTKDAKTTECTSLCTHFTNDSKNKQRLDYRFALEASCFCN
jgi:hypothetical protein